MTDGMKISGMSLSEKFVKTPIWLIVTLVWAVLGLVVWAPIVFRNVAIASFVSVSRILKGEDISATVKSISDSIMLYPLGFVHVFKGVFGEGGSGNLYASRSLTIRSLPFELLLGVVILFVIHASVVSDLPFQESLRNLFINAHSMWGGFVSSVAYILGTSSY